MTLSNAKGWTAAARDYKYPLRNNRSIMQTFIEYLVEGEHPMRYAYEVQNGNDIRVLAGIQKFVRSAMGADGPEPKIYVTSQEHMMEYAKRSPHYRTGNVVYGLFAQSHPDRVYVSDRVRLGSNVAHAAVLAHEIAHYYQYQRGDFQTKSVDEMESEADDILARYYHAHK